MPSNASPNSMVCASGTIIATMVTLQIMPSWMMSVRQGKTLPSVVSVPTTRTGWQKGTFGTSPKVPEPCSCMLPTSGPRQSPLTFGHKHLNMPQMFRMLYQEKENTVSHLTVFQHNNRTKHQTFPSLQLSHVCSPSTSTNWWTVPQME